MPFAKNVCKQQGPEHAEPLPLLFFAFFAFFSFLSITMSTLKKSTTLRHS